MLLCGSDMIETLSNGATLYKLKQEEELLECNVNKKQAWQQ
jgi:hypothetical protein